MEYGWAGQAGRQVPIDVYTHIHVCLYTIDVFVSVGGGYDQINKYSFV